MLQRTASPSMNFIGIFFWEDEWQLNYQLLGSSLRETLLVSKAGHCENHSNVQIWIIYPFQFFSFNVSHLLYIASCVNCIQELSRSFPAAFACIIDLNQAVSLGFLLCLLLNMSKKCWISGSIRKYFLLGCSVH